MRRVGKNAYCFFCGVPFEAGQVWPRLDPSALPPAIPNAEVMERLVVHGPTELAFALHTRAAAAFFARA